MWKKIRSVTLRYGLAYCVFGVFGVFVVLLPWLKSKPIPRRPDQ